MQPQELADPIFGNEGRVFIGDKPWAAFRKEFGPTKGYITIYVDVINGDIPKSQRDLYIEIEAWYPRVIPDIFESIFREITRYETAKKFSSPDKIQNHFQLKSVDIRGHIPPSKCVLHYQTGVDVFDWYVRISKDYRIECCGPED